MLSLLVEKYLEDKKHLQTENDSICIDESGIVSWNFQNIPQPSMEDLFVFEDLIKKNIDQQKINQEALAFLAATDWMVIRAMERGEELSPEIKAERQAARDRIVK
jgi:hypothetical protein